jgi:membrane-bound ClpP family serine protease
MIKIIVATFIGCLCEYFAFAHILDAPNWLLIVLLHGIASLCFTFVSHAFIPNKYKTTLKSGSALLFLLLFTLPVFGILGVVFAITFALSKPLKNNDIDIESTRFLPCPLKQEVFQQRLFTQWVD